MSAFYGIDILILANYLMRTHSSILSQRSSTIFTFSYRTRTIKVCATTRANHLFCLLCSRRGYLRRGCYISKTCYRTVDVRHNEFIKLFFVTAHIIFKIKVFGCLGRRNKCRSQFTSHFLECTENRLICIVLYIKNGNTIKVRSKFSNKR